jgi:hypothetical protein
MGLGGPGQLPAPGSHRSVRAGLPHTAPQIMVSLRFGPPIVPLGARETDTAHICGGTAPTSSAHYAIDDRATFAKFAGSRDRNTEAPLCCP